VPAVHTEALVGRDETWRWMSAAAGTSGDRVLASIYAVFTDADVSEPRPRPYVGL